MGSQVFYNLFYYLFFISKGQIVLFQYNEDVVLKVVVLFENFFCVYFFFQLFIHFLHKSLGNSQKLVVKKLGHGDVLKNLSFLLAKSIIFFSSILSLFLPNFIIMLNFKGFFAWKNQVLMIGYFWEMKRVI